MDKNKFLELLKLPSRANHNQPIHEYIKHTLNSLGISYSIYEDTTIYNIDDPTLPLFSSHTDTVRSSSCDKKAEKSIEEFEIQEAPGITLIRNGQKAILGGDDMCGIHIILEMLREGKRFNFLFTDNEENINGSSRYFVRDFKQELSVLPYGIVLDRKGKGDIICSYNRYGHIDFENELCRIGEPFGFRPEKGLCSDADHIRNVMSCANLSIGYYQAHSQKEFVAWQHMENTHDYAIAILENIHEKFPTHQAIFTSYFEESLIDNFLMIADRAGVLGYR